MTCYVLISRARGFDPEVLTTKNERRIPRGSSVASSPVCKAVLLPARAGLSCEVGAE